MPTRGVTLRRPLSGMSQNNDATAPILSPSHGVLTTDQMLSGCLLPRATQTPSGPVWIWTCVCTVSCRPEHPPQILPLPLIGCPLAPVSIPPWTEVVDRTCLR